MSARAPSRSRRKPTLDRSVVERRVLFWLAVLVLVVLALWLLSEILLPFVAGLAIDNPMKGVLAGTAIGAFAALILWLVDRRRAG